MAGYEYRMEPFPETLRSRAEIAHHLETFSATVAAKGWEFYRIDNVSVQIPNGCLASLIGQPYRLEHVHIMTFRKPIPDTQ